jgi:hypothetical protein
MLSRATSSESQKYCASQRQLCNTLLETFFFGSYDSDSLHQSLAQNLCCCAQHLEIVEKVAQINYNFPKEF